MSDKPSKKQDLRARYTKQILGESLLQLLEEKPLGKITVKELCAAADINRATFYAHFSDIYELMDEMKKELEKNVLEHMEKWVSDTRLDKRESLTEYLRFTRENAFLYLLMREENGADSLRSHTWEVVKRHQLSHPPVSAPQLPENQQEYLLVFYTYGITQVIDEWLRQDAPISAHELADMLYRYCIPEMQGRPLSGGNGP
ncbi:MAG: TetR/AcrR family transcriptional regulator [Clostridiales Family XIII bacterium]|jgi:AcrR family transcriptional regulator|nr:TetR/AcrR family transcriptional regulator [Clostridiales Family XIII bacterium]